MARNKETGKSILIARFSAIGDVAMTVPVIYSACRCYPDKRFVLLTRKAMSAIFVNAPENLVIEGVDLQHDYNSAGKIYNLAKEVVKRYHTDTFIDLHDVIRTRIIGMYCKLHGVRVARINKGRGSKRTLTRRNNKVMLPLISQRARYREAFYRAGLPLSERFNGLFDGHGKAAAEAYSVITKPKGLNDKWIGVAPFAAHSGKIYPIELMHEVVTHLAEQPNNTIYLLGGGGEEQAVLSQWSAEKNNVICLAGKRYGFSAELALLNHMDVMLTMDSANMHLASIASTPTISVWGATHPYCGFKGWRQNDADMVQLPLPCRPCSVFGDKACYRGDLLCLNAIKPEMLINKVNEKLNG